MIPSVSVLFTFKVTFSQVLFTFTQVTDFPVTLYFYVSNQFKQYLYFYLNTLDAVRMLYPVRKLRLNCQNCHCYFSGCFDRKVV
jgi:hypothetical protein